MFATARIVPDVPTAVLKRLLAAGFRSAGAGSAQRRSFLSSRRKPGRPRSAPWADRAEVEAFGEDDPLLLGDNDLRRPAADVDDEERVAGGRESRRTARIVRRASSSPEMTRGRPSLALQPPPKLRPLSASPHGAGRDGRDPGPPAARARAAKRVTQSDRPPSPPRRGGHPHRRERSPARDRMISFSRRPSSSWSGSSGPHPHEQLDGVRPDVEVVAERPHLRPRPLYQRPVEPVGSHRTGQDAAKATRIEAGICLPPPPCSPKEFPQAVQPRPPRSFYEAAVASRQPGRRFLLRRRGQGLQVEHLTQGDQVTQQEHSASCSRTWITPIDREGRPRPDEGAGRRPRPDRRRRGPVRPLQVPPPTPELKASTS